MERDVGLHTSRADDGNVYVVLVVFGLDGLKEAIECMFGTRIGAAHGEPKASGNTGGDGQMSATLGYHAGQDGLGKDDGGVVIEIHYAADDAKVGFYRCATLADAGIVVEDIDAAITFPCLNGQAFQLVEESKVAR